MRRMDKPTITLLTDFGTQDAFVGVMKGVILNIQPDVNLVDLTHQITPQDVQQAARVLRYSVPYFTPETIHLVVVDPGVGSTRRAMAAKTPHGIFVAPDNGVLTDMLRVPWDAIALDNRQYWRIPDPSQTFHGRDIFSPVAAHLAAGVPLRALGTGIIDPVMMPRRRFTRQSQTEIRGEVTYIDHFGDVTTNITPVRWASETTIHLSVPEQPVPVSFDARTAKVISGWHTLEGINRTYSDVPIGEPLALIGSGGELEIAVNRGRAAQELSLSVGDPITLSFAPSTVT